MSLRGDSHSRALGKFSVKRTFKLSPIINCIERFPSPFNKCVHQHTGQQGCGLRQVRNAGSACVQKSYSLRWCIMRVLEAKSFKSSREIFNADFPSTCFLNRRPTFKNWRVRNDVLESVRGLVLLSHLNIPVGVPTPGESVVTPFWQVALFHVGGVEQHFWKDRIPLCPSPPRCWWFPRVHPPSGRLPALAMLTPGCKRWELLGTNFSCASFQERKAGQRKEQEVTEEAEKKQHFPEDPRRG